MQVGDHHQMHVLGLEVRDQLRQVGIGLRVDRERAQFVLKVDVEPDGVGRDLVGAQAIRDPLGLSLSHIAPVRLLEAQRPFGGQRRPAGQPGIVLDDVARRRAGHDVIIDAAALYIDVERVRFGLAEVEGRAPGVVHEEAETLPLLIDAQHERDRLIERVGRDAEAEIVGVPQGEGFVAAVQRPGLVAEAEIMRVDRHGFAQPEALPQTVRVELQRRPFGVGQHDMARLVIDGDGQRRLVDLHRGRAGRDGGHARRLGHIERRMPRAHVLRNRP